MPQDVSLRHPDQGRIVTDFVRVGRGAVDDLTDCYSGYILDWLGKYGAMSVNILPISPGMRMCGPALTVLGPDYSVKRMAIDMANPGDVLVVAASGIDEYACFGDGTARRMMLKGMIGAVIDGATRDTAGLRELRFPTFARGITPRNYHYPVSGEYGGINVPVVCGGVLVNPGDLVFGDDDGVIVVPRLEAERLSGRIREGFEQELQQEAALKSYVPYGVEEELRQRSYRFE